MCAARVERLLAHQPGVARAMVNLGTERALVAFDRNRTTDAELAAAVREIGYQPRSDQISPDGGGV